MNKAVFLDKDGTLVKDVPYNVNSELVSYSGFAVEALKLLQQEGYLLIVISNQSGIARGYFTEPDLAVLFNSIRLDMLAHEIRIAGFYYCPHLPDATIPGFSKHCDCRKPAPGMMLQASADFDIDLGRSWMIGDILDDIEAGNRAGCKTILLNAGNETEWKINSDRLPYYYADDLIAAAQIILNNANPVLNEFME
jgi:D-glycero-D-manno-heptose 1,7-bisphosphate phosphatase